MQSQQVIISSLPSGQSVLNTTLELALQFQIAWPTWSNLQNNYIKGFNSLIIKGVRGFYFRPGLLPLIKHPAHQVSQTGFENAASGFVLSRRNPVCSSWWKLSNASQHTGQYREKVKRFTSQVPSSSKSKYKRQAYSTCNAFTPYQYQTLVLTLSSYAYFGKQEKEKFLKPLCLLAAYLWTLLS